MEEEDADADAEEDEGGRMRRRLLLQLRGDVLARTPSVSPSHTAHVLSHPLCISLTQAVEEEAGEYLTAKSCNPALAALFHIPFDSTPFKTTV